MESCSPTGRDVAQTKPDSWASPKTAASKQASIMKSVAAIGKSRKAGARKAPKLDQSQQEEGSRQSISQIYQTLNEASLSKYPIRSSTVFS